mgnify:FL=1
MSNEKPKEIEKFYIIYIYNKISRTGALYTQRAHYAHSLLFAGRTKAVIAATASLENKQRREPH